jgi:hypothetical protein
MWSEDDDEQNRAGSLYRVENEPSRVLTMDDEDGDGDDGSCLLFPV